ncbi:PCNA-associated factor [Amyelois transitella]|uniref:PCNA-associated factor n=1 Tax=Amyelois transitella TaxID=680683 RepID=UPI00067DF604|nr:PCNA-associated factor [Amyelois transitella]
MARTKASVGSKVSSGKSSKARCSVATPPSSAVASGSGERSSKSSSGGNPVCPRETPTWQRPITNFFISKETNGTAEPGDPDEETATSSKTKPKRNIIESDDDEEEECPKNRELDESINLEPLTGENCHKLDEYYPKNGVKGKGVGKKTQGKENVDNNNTRKRDLEDFVEEQESKKVKVC